jgi:hypothetical protein
MLEKAHYYINHTIFLITLQKILCKKQQESSEQNI